MPVDPNADIEISAFAWVPPFAEGLVRDLRPRWALEEIGLPYRVRLLARANPRPPEYFLDQPFGQVPCYSDGPLKIFESGAIVQHIGEKSEKLLPRDPVPRMRADRTGPDRGAQQRRAGDQRSRVDRPLQQGRGMGQIAPPGRGRISCA